MLDSSVGLAVCEGVVGGGNSVEERGGGKNGGAGDQGRGVERGSCKNGL